MPTGHIILPLLAVWLDWFFYGPYFIQCQCSQVFVLIAQPLDEMLAFEYSSTT